MFDKPVSFNTGMQNTNDVRFFERRKVWYCISCAKHRGIFEKKKRLAIDRAKKML
jgi:sulfur relay (sulfurtransferase) complex TusBCD TusD component (DsrE family)